MSLGSIQHGLFNVRRYSKHPGMFAFGCLIWVLAALCQLIWWITRWLARRPAAASVICVSLLALIEVGQVMAIATFITLTCAAVTYQVVRFGRRWGGSPNLGPILSDLSSLSLRSWRLKRRWAFAASNIKLLHQAAQEPPRLHRVRYESPTRISAVVSMAGTGKTLEQVTAEHLAVLASELSIRRVTASPVPGRSGLAAFTFHWGSPLDDVLELERLPEPQPGMAMFGINDRGDPVGLSVKLSTLLVGASRSGKSSTVWAMVTSALEQSKRPDGVPVQFWVVDQSQTEFNAIQPLAHKYAKGQFQALGLLRELWAECATRAESMGDDGTRVWEPTVERPQIVLIIDEMLMLVSKKLDTPKERVGKNADGLLFLLLTQAAKYGVVVWCGTQASKIQVVGDNRDWFQQRVCHKSSHREMTDCALGERAAASGAECHKLQVPEDAGIGWMHDHERSGFQQFRSVYVRDDDVRTIGRGQIPLRLRRAHGAIVEPGHVYTFWGPEGPDGRRECLYVGQTSEPNPADRWERHLIGGTAKDWAEEVDLVQCDECADWDAAKREERRLIHQLRPKYNKVRYITERVS